MMLEACERLLRLMRRVTWESPNDGVRSGIGLISGWVCAANSVEIRISNAQGRVATLNAAYGTTRADTVGECDHQEDTTGFGMTYNFNHLPEGTYTIRAYADGITRNRIGSARTFEVVHLVDFAAIDDDRFLRGLKGMSVAWMTSLKCWRHHDSGVGTEYPELRD